MSEPLSTAELKALIDSGDVDLANYREAYRAQSGRETTLTDAQICELVRYEWDDFGDESRAKIMLLMEQGASAEIAVKHVEGEEPEYSE